MVKGGVSIPITILSSSITSTCKRKQLAAYLDYTHPRVNLDGS
jgi:hypothetical protein